MRKTKEVLRENDRGGGKEVVAGRGEEEKLSAGTRSKGRQNGNVRDNSQRR